MSRFYPVFLDIEGKRAVVIGGGPVAHRKAASLIEAGAAVTVISPEAVPAIKRLADRGLLTHKPRRYRKGDLRGAVVAVAATDDPSVNERVASEAKALDILINCATPPNSGNFIVPSSIKKGALTLAISTGGASPALSKRLRLDLEGFLGTRYSWFLEFLEEARVLLKGEVEDEAARQEILRKLVDQCLAGDANISKNKALSNARALLESLLR
jgi:precorrin-2 dehydrogenase/sirohydrochlorin ferrochelatase